MDASSTSFDGEKRRSFNPTSVFPPLAASPADLERLPLITSGSGRYSPSEPYPSDSHRPSSDRNFLIPSSPRGSFKRPSSIKRYETTSINDEPTQRVTKIEDEEEGGHHSHNNKPLTLLKFVFIGYFCVCGGPYGLEVAVGAGYPLVTFLCILIIPWIWSLPMALMVAELGTAMPDNDGYVLWIKTGFGPFLSFLAGFIAWMNAVVDNALYPSLFMSYLTSILAKYEWIHNDVYFYLLQFSVVFFVMGLNMTGVDIVSKISFLFAILVISPFVVMFIWSAESHHIHPKDWLVGPPDWSQWPVCLNIIIWSYSGFDSVGLMAEELQNPKRNFPLAMLLIILMSMGTYLVSLTGAVGLDTNYAKWGEGYFSMLAGNLGGDGFKIFMIVGGMVSSLGLFNALLLASSNELRAFGRKDLLGVRALVWRHPYFKTPWTAIIFNSVLVAGFGFLPFTELVELNNILYCTLLLMIYAALIKMRFTHKEMVRPYKISESNILTILLCIPPILICCYIIGNAARISWLQFVVAIAVVVFGTLLYWVLWFARRKK